MMDAFIGLGSNLGDRLGELRRAASALATIGLLRARSAIYETAAVLSGAPVSAEASAPYLNAALWLQTQLQPGELIERLLAIEAHAGRVRVPGEREAARPIDLDVLLLGRGGELVLVGERLTVPHPRLHQRAFALRPLLDLSPALVHPALGLPLQVLYTLLPADPPPPRPLGWL
jgi:2-amino-4-hydroxy-6-hydroxymethyldihydropteridine diphosphokinase